MQVGSEALSLLGLTESMFVQVMNGLDVLEFFFSNRNHFIALNGLPNLGG
jgi:hypothetical protein